MKVCMTKPTHLMFATFPRAPCGALVVSANPEMELEPSSWEERLDKVTCVFCRQAVVRLARSYNQARRKKQIDW